MQEFIAVYLLYSIAMPIYLLPLRGVCRETFSRVFLLKIEANSLFFSSFVRWKMILTSSILQEIATLCDHAYKLHRMRLLFF